MAATRSPEEIEKDIVNIEHALLTVSEIRSSLKNFTNLVQSEEKGPNFVHSISDRLKIIRRDLHTLSAESENLKGALEYAQIKASENNFNWSLIKSVAEKEAVEEENRYQEENSGKAKEIGSVVKANAQHAYKALSSVIIDYKSTLTPADPLFFTKHIQDWLNTNKPEDINFSVIFTVPEHVTLTGSTCSIKVFSRKSLVVDLELEYERGSDTLIIHQYDIKSVKEQVCGFISKINRLSICYRNTFGKIQNTWYFKNSNYWRQVLSRTCWSILQKTLYIIFW
ncbi:uncharacterized protein B0P05DRAFT_522207 [Gilbertella persicaria]|uniref:uncharacterized protein n=1 Tax=Gilbertella persicaria TaxID=101096 RepID=UPI00221FBAFA|nr:uncharacterized protein B0P05DRAFT_522207 [Gilbertella persicaria]KAI8097820.1 hypothetical protein B0P05DRAFT_522207 [Gilbertella persicaria]